MESVGSTSWPNRHRAYFERLGELLRVRGGVPHVVIVGPGAVTTLCRPLLHDTATYAGRVRLLLGDLARYADQLFRRIPGMPLVSLEPVEVAAALRMEHRMTVVDVSDRVLGAVARSLPSAGRLRVDLGRERLPVVADAIIAFNVISRIEDGESAMRNLLAGLPMGGLLLADERTTNRLLPAGQFEAVAEKTHRRLIVKP